MTQWKHLSIVVMSASTLVTGGSALADSPLTSGTEPSPWGFTPAAFTVAGSLADNSREGPRTYSLTRTWQFVRGGKEQPASGAAWTRVNLPHSGD